MSAPLLRRRIREAYCATASAYERRWERYLHTSLDRTIQAARLTSGERLLDLGCGTGLLLRQVMGAGSGVECWGVDLSPEMLRIAHRESTGTGTFLAGDVSNLPFSDEQFDAVVSSSSLHHWPAPEAAFAEIRRVLRPGGRLVITDWNRSDWLFKPLAIYLEHFDRSVHHIYSMDDARQVMARAGFHVTGIHPFRIAPAWGMMTAVGRRRDSAEA